MFLLNSTVKSLETWHIDSEGHQQESGKISVSLSFWLLQEREEKLHHTDAVNCFTSLVPHTLLLICFPTRASIFVLLPPGSCHPTEKNSCLPESVCCAYGSIPEPLLHSVRRGLYNLTLTSMCTSVCCSWDQTLTCRTSSPQKLANISLRIQQIETTLSILEAKVSSRASAIVLSGVSRPGTHLISNVVVPWAAVLHPWTGGRHHRGNRSGAAAADCTG